MIVQPPTPELIKAIDAFDVMIGELIRAKGSYSSDFGTFEAPVEAYVLLNTGIRTAEAIGTLARTDAVLMPAAHQLSRSLFEIAVRTTWLLLPDNPFEREARWLAHLKSEELMWERLARIARATGEPVADYSSRAQQLYAFRSGVADRLREHTDSQSELPNLRDALKEQQMERRYVAYVLYSQFVHGGHFAGSSFRQGLGTGKELREATFHSEWPACIQMAWWSLNHAAARFIEVACPPGTTVCSSATHEALDAALVAAESAARDDAVRKR